MPVMVVGADTPVGEVIIGELTDPDREVRAFVSDPSVGISLKDAGVKVAVGDVSDASHVSAACLRCHTVVLVCDAGRDGREISFAADAAELFAQWAQAVCEAGAKRLIWVANHPVPEARVPEQATVDSSLSAAEIANRVADLDDAVAL